MVFLVVIIASFLLQLFLPWWVVVVICFATCGLIGKTGKIAFWQPFFAIVLLWIGMALYQSIPNNHVLATRVAVMLGLKLWPLVLAVMALLGGITAGISGYCGYQFRKAMINSKKQPS
jgi:O-antigen ligase